MKLRFTSFLIVKQEQCFVVFTLGSYISGTNILETNIPFGGVIFMSHILKFCYYQSIRSAMDSYLYKYKKCKYLLRTKCSYI